MIVLSTEIPVLRNLILTQHVIQESLNVVHEEKVECYEPVVEEITNSDM